MPRLVPSIACLVLCAFALPATAGVLYRCEAKDGVIAYTNKPDGFPKCKALSHYADSPPAHKPPPAAAPPRPRTTVTQGWVYEEQAPEKPKADFSHVAAAVRVDPPEAARASFDGVAAGIASTARLFEPEDFSAVLADVSSTATTVGTPLFVAAPYRPRARPALPPRALPPVVDPAAAIASAAPAVRVVRGSVYRVQRKDGILEYTNVRPKAGAFAVLFTYIATCVACDVHSKIDFARTALNLEAYRNEIASAAADYGVDTALLRAVIHAESAFNPLAVSNKGAQGLMQLMPSTANDLGVIDAFDVAQNIRGGARYLAQLLQAFNGDPRLATAAYNAGPGAVQKYGGVPPYDETRVYVERVATLRDRYRKAL